MSACGLKRKKPIKIVSEDVEFPTNWDIDRYKTQHESEEHWQLRRRFMEAHKKKFPEDELVCLAQVFTNVEFMGCKYPAETMRRVAELSEDVAKNFREHRAKKLKRTFVAASDAAEQRYAKAQQQQQQSQKQPQSVNTTKYGSSIQLGKRKQFGDDHNGKRARLQNGTNLFDNLPYDNFVLTLTGGRNCIRNSAQRGNVEFQEKESGYATKMVEIYLGGKLVASAEDLNVKLSKTQAFNNALEILRRSCYSIKPNPLRDTIKIDKSNNQVVCGVTKQQVDTLEDKKLDATNKGYKMMKMMGWTGGGLGSKTQGREEPVGYLLKNNRAGLGNAAGKLDREYFTQMLKNYVASDDIRELQFEPTFTKEERAILHEIASNLQLRSSSSGKNENRRLVISKKMLCDEEILSEILIHQNPKYVDKYLVQVPETKMQLYPEYTVKLELDF